MTVKDIETGTKKINAAIAEAGTRDNEKVDDLIAHYTGPATGLYWSEGDCKLKIAEDWCEDEDGNIVNPYECTGPATGLEYRDGKVRRVQKK